MITLLLTLMFVDNTFTIDSGPDLNTVINIEINKMAIGANKLAVNINKTKYMIFRFRSKRIDVHLPTVVYCIMKTKLENHVTIICLPP
jgi:hypothetical protein